MTTRYRGPEDDGRRIPKSGPDVFRGDPTEARGVCLVPMLGLGLVRCRFPKQTDKPLRPDAKMPEPEVIIMADKPRITGTTYKDPYATLPIEVEDAAQREGETKGAAA